MYGPVPIGVEAHVVALASCADARMLNVGNAMDSGKSFCGLNRSTANVKSSTLRTAITFASDVTWPPSVHAFVMGNLYLAPRM